MQYVGDDGPPAEVRLVLVHRRVVIRLVQRILAAPQLGRDLLLQLVRKAALQHVLMRMDHRVAVEHHIQQAADLAVRLDGVMHRPAAIVDQAACRGVEPFHVVPARAPHERAVAEVGHLVVVLGDVLEQLDHDGRVIVLELAPVEQVVLVLGQDALEDVLGDAVRDVAVDLRVVAPHAQVVHGGADDLVPNEAVLGAGLHGGVLAEDLDHVRGEREVRHAGVAGDLVAAVLAGVGHAHVGVAVDRAAVAAVHLDRVLLGVGAFVLGRLHAAVAHGVDLAGFRLAGLDGLALGVGPVQALARRPTAALVVVLGPFLLG